MFDAQADLARAHQQLGALVARRDPARAATARRAAQAIAERLVAHDPTNADWRQLLGSDPI